MTNWKKISCLLLPTCGTLLSGCGATQYEFDAAGGSHITQETVAQEQPVAPSNVPDLIGSTAQLPDLAYEGSTTLFDIVVENVSVRQVFLSLADQAQLNLDVDPRVDGLVSMNAYGQTLDQIFERIRRQLPIRYEKIGGSLVVLNDDLYFKQYSLTFPDLARSFSATVSGEVPSAGEATPGSSDIEVEKNGEGSLWDSLQEAMDVVLEQGYVEYDFVAAGPFGADESTELAGEIATDLAERGGVRVVDEPFVHMLRDAGLIIAFASSEQHRLLDDIIRTVTETSRRQVLLQATVVEIALNNNYQQGIDWSIFNETGPGPRFLQSETGNIGSALPTPSIEQITNYRTSLEALIIDSTGAPDVAAINALVNTFSAIKDTPGSSATGGFLNSSFTVGDLDFAISLLDKFGDTRVVSSPRISTLNGQGAILKVVEDQVFFSVETTVETDDDGLITETIEVEAQTIPVGMVVSVYPQIGADGSIVLAMRPSISRVTGFAEAPSVGAITSALRVPIISIKEIETLMLLNDGQTAVLGGLIEDLSQDGSTGIPGANKIPGIGGLFENVSQSARRLEYVIFVSAKIIRNPSIHGDYREFKELLPSDEIFQRDQTRSFFGNEISAVPRGR